MILKGRQLIRKFFILGVLLGCLGVVSTLRSWPGQLSAEAEKEVLLKISSLNE